MFVYLWLSAATENIGAVSHAHNYNWWLSEKYYNGGECDIPQALLSCINMSIRHRLQSVINTNGDHKMCRLFAKFWSLDFKTWCCTIVVSGDIMLLYLKALYDIIYNLYCLFVQLDIIGKVWKGNANRFQLSFLIGRQQPQMVQKDCIWVPLCSKTKSDHHDMNKLLEFKT